MLPELKASELLLRPQLVEQIQNTHLVLIHESSGEDSAKTLDDAVAMLTASGWRRIDLAVTKSQSVLTIFALMERVPKESS